MITEVATDAAIWGCTTCGWCEEGCPVGIEHIQRIIDMRRYDTLMESRFPAQAINAFKGIENQGNPWGIAQEERADWAEGLDIPVMAEAEQPEAMDVLYWVGCAVSYDERNQLVSRSFASLMKLAGVASASSAPRRYVAAIPQNQEITASMGETFFRLARMSSIEPAKDHSPNCDRF